MGACFKVSGRGARNERDAQAGLQQSDEVAFGCELVALIHIEMMAANECCRLFRLLAIGAPQPALLSQVFDLDHRMRGETMPGIEDQAELFGEQRPAIETLPFLADVPRNGELGVSRL